LGSENKKATLGGVASENVGVKNAGLFDLFVERVALEEGVVLLLFDALGDGLFIARGEVTGSGLTFFFSFGAFECDEVLHGFEKIKGR
jgi:hypothetical protein